MINFRNISFITTKEVFSKLNYKKNIDHCAFYQINREKCKYFGSFRKGDNCLRFEYDFCEIVGFFCVLVLFYSYISYWLKHKSNYTLDSS